MSSRSGSLRINSRRGPHKAHIPFRGDDLEHGKKTGKAVNKVSRDADDFESFQEVLDQAYHGDNVPRALSSTRLVNGRSRRGSPLLPDDGDDNGELSMDIDSTHNSPATYFNAALPPQPSSSRRVGSSSRPLGRSSDVDYDRIPSPKSASQRTFSQPSYPSRLRHEIQDDARTRKNVAYDGDDVNDGLGDPNFSESDGAGPSPLHSRGNISFTELAQNDDDDGCSPEREPSYPILTSKSKGKRRAEILENLNEDEDARIEEDIATELQEVEDDPINGGEEWISSPRNKRSRGDEKEPSPEIEKPSKKPKPKRTKEKVPLVIGENLNREGLRRSQRRHYPPLEYWRQEKVVWGRREKGPDKGPSYVPVIKEIVTIPKPLAQPLGAKKRKRAGTLAPKSRSKSLTSENPIREEVRIIEVDNPELGWDDETPSHGVILDLESGGEVQRRVAFTAKMVKPTPAGNSNYLFQKIFGDGDFIAGGQLVIPPGQEKPAKPTKDNTYIFYLIEGAVQFRVHRSTFILATGGMFLVPRGNQYYIQNICQRDAKLFFAQARKIIEGENQGFQTSASVPQRARTTPRSSSHGALSPKQKAKV